MMSDPWNEICSGVTNSIELVIALLNFQPHITSIKLGVVPVPSNKASRPIAKDPLIQSLNDEAIKSHHFIQPLSVREGWPGCAMIRPGYTAISPGHAMFWQGYAPISPRYANLVSSSSLPGMSTLLKAFQR